MNFLNQACSHNRPTHVPGFRVCVCMYVSMYVYLFVFPHSHEQTFYLKLESNLYTNNKG